MVESNKIVAIRKNLRQPIQSQEINKARANPNGIMEIDLSFNQLDNGSGLDAFQNLETLILDHNSFSTLNQFPRLQNLKTLSLAYCQLRDFEQVVAVLSVNTPVLKHLNLIKNPCNPMFQMGGQNYSSFRAKIKVWLSTLETLDGTDFVKDQAEINKVRSEVEYSKPALIQKHVVNAQSSKQLATIPENPAQPVGADEDVFSALKKKAVAEQQKGTDTKATLEFNQRAYKKYSSQKSLVERILKSHSEGNRFIRNEDL